MGTGTAHADNPRLTARTGGGSDADWQAGTETQLGAPHQPSPVVFDDEDRENEGDLIMPAQTVTPEWMGFMVRHTSGVICEPMLPERATELDLRPMVANNQDPTGTAYTVSCDAAAGVSTGIGVADRAHTANLLANPGANTSDFTRPGHMFPLIAKPGGVRERDGHTEAGVEFARLAGGSYPHNLCRTEVAVGRQRSGLRAASTQSCRTIPSFPNRPCARARSENLLEALREEAAALL